MAARRIEVRRNKKERELSLPPRVPTKQISYNGKLGQNTGREIVSPLFDHLKMYSSSNTPGLTPAHGTSRLVSRI